MKKGVLLIAVILMTGLTSGGLAEEARADDPEPISFDGENIAVPPASTGPNSDGDAIADAADLCPGTQAGVPANMNGCSQAQTDPTGAPAALPRATSDRVDDITGFQMHYVYLVPSDRTDQGRDTNGQLAQSIAAQNSWLTGQTARGWRMDTSGAYGAWDITFVGSALTDAQFQQCSPYPVLSCIQSELAGRGMNSSSKRYAVYYEGDPPPHPDPSRIICGQATPIGDGSQTDYGAIFLRALGGCNTDIFSDSGTQPRWVEDIVLHETMHTLGIVGTGAPNTCGDSPHHVCDDVPNDLMYKSVDDFPQNLDVNHQDYWQHGSFAYFDLARSSFLDEDGVPDQFDNCPGVANANQANYDGDSQGDACDADDDNDGTGDVSDNCQFAWNPGQENTDGDAQGDACDADDDNDTKLDGSDNCPLAANVNQEDNVHPATPPGTPPGDACDDPDNDRVFDSVDNCADWYNPDQNLPPWLLPANDLDCDGVSAAVEDHVGTAPSVHCGRGAWPPDITDNTFVDTADMAFLTSSFGLQVPNQAPVRYDVAGSGFVDTGDIQVLTSLFGMNCGTVTPNGYYHPVTPARILDTREPGGGGPIEAGDGGARSVQVTDIGGVPATSVTAVVINVAVAAPTTAGHLTVYKSDDPRPQTTSNLNFAAGQTVANLVTVGVGGDGNVKVYNSGGQTGGQTHVIIDISGWYGAPSGGSLYNAVTAKRILDTRGGPKIGPNASITVDVTDTFGSGVPASGVTAVAVHAAVVEPTAESHLRIYPSQEPRPSTANLNFPAGQTVSNLVIVKVGVGNTADGKVNVYNAAGSTHVIFDVVGWYGASGDVFNLVTPSRVLDTRDGAPVGAGDTAARTVSVTGVGGVPASGVQAVVVNAAVTQPTAASFLTIYPSLTLRPQPASDLNFAAQQTVANLVIAKVLLDGNVNVYNDAGQTHVIFDTAGYFGPPPPAGGSSSPSGPEGPQSPESSQSPRISIDMDPAGNTYTDTTNRMDVGQIDKCLMTLLGNNASHNHVAHLVIQDVQNLVGWQARMNYDGGKMRPLNVNFSPFTDGNAGQGVSFLNLPLDGGSHRSIVPASSIPAPGSGPQTALIGAVYLGGQNAAVSPDTPPKAPPDDTSYSAPSGGVLAAITLRVEAGQVGQSLSMDLDDGNPNAPGSKVIVFTGSGVEEIELGEGSLGDGAHGEGIVCLGVTDIQPGRYAASLDGRQRQERKMEA